MGTPYDKNNPLHALIIGPNGPIPQKYSPEANSGQGGMVPSTVDDVQKVQQSGSIDAKNHKKDIVRRRIDKIIDVIGINSVQAFFPFWEEGGGPYKDILNPEESSFSSYYGEIQTQEGGLFSGYAQTNYRDFLVQDPVHEYDVYDKELTRANRYALKVDLDRRYLQTSTMALRLKRIGDLPNATVKISIRRDDAGEPHTSGFANNWFP